MLHILHNCVHKSSYRKNPRTCNNLKQELQQHLCLSWNHFFPWTLSCITKRYDVQSWSTEMGARSKLDVDPTHGITTRTKYTTSTEIILRGVLWTMHYKTQLQKLTLLDVCPLTSPFVTIHRTVARITLSVGEKQAQLRQHNRQETSICTNRGARLRTTTKKPCNISV